ncbi:MAG TPA: TIGR03067 domain-containing protein [Gemmataceae bacterium]|jgi:uncharacterized protein (TIGR03067 family)|nr:TIGR03067 domain-containing protein [Gemmataceae bacterium]
MIRLIALAAILFLPATRLMADEASDKVLKQLEGEWKIEKMLFGGIDPGPDKVDKTTLIFKGDEITPSDNPKDVAKIKVDPSKKPAQIDLTDKANKTMPGIYELNGDELKICFAESETRPTEFASPKDSKQVLIVLKRIKK